MEQKIRELNRIVKNGKRMVFFGGAGVSTESGIPDFRSQDGLYSQNYAYPPEQILSGTFFERHTEEFFAFYRDKMIVQDAQPNAAHLKLTELEQAGKLNAVITQNIDGLHQKAGNRNVFELHGSVHRNFCRKCGKSYSLEIVFSAVGVPLCECGGIIKPDVVLYEESLDHQVIEGAIEAIRKADILIIGGTSLVVYPAAGFVNYFTGEELVIINKSSTAMDSKANLVIAESIAMVMSQIIL